MTRSTAFAAPPLGTGPWRCPVCERVTVTCYRCSHGDCGADLTGRSLRRA